MKKNDSSALICEVTRLLPVPVLVLDESLCVHYLNDQAQDLLNERFSLKMPRRCGDVLHCLHALQPDACCGQTEHCPQCLIRQLVIRACREEGAFTERAQISRTPGDDRYTEALVRVSSLRLDGQALAIVMLQDIPELSDSAGLLRLCAWCHKVGQGEQWIDLGDYLETDLSLRVTHGMCSECADRWKQEHDQE
ncbi:MAG: hypothetical protein ACYC63_16750 [Armatimonadota bacterium]